MKYSKAEHQQMPSAKQEEKEEQLECTSLCIRSSLSEGMDDS